MTLEGYQNWTHETEAGPVKNWAHNQRLLYFAVGLVGESGEAAEKIKKLVRDHDGNIKVWEQREVIVKELGDILWYMSQLCNEVSTSLLPDERITFLELFQTNREKLTARHEHGTIQGSGDNR